MVKWGQNEAWLPDEQPGDSFLKNLVTELKCIEVEKWNKKRVHFNDANFNGKAKQKDSCEESLRS